MLYVKLVLHEREYWRVDTIYCSPIVTVSLICLGCLKAIRAADRSIVGNFWPITYLQRKRWKGLFWQD
jgi:hypothetical protein